jgi:hypothetical protein
MRNKCDTIFYLLNCCSVSSHGRRAIHRNHGVVAYAVMYGSKNQKIVNVLASCGWPLEGEGYHCRDNYYCTAKHGPQLYLKTIRKLIVRLHFEITNVYEAK